MSDNELVHLVYASKASWSMSNAALRNLLTSSRTNNEKLGITGLLLYHNESFLQLLEGPVGIVRGLLDEHIRHDKRHENVTVLFEKQIQQREFIDWKMGFQNVDQIPPVERPGFMSFNDFRFTKMEQQKQSSTAHALLLAFKSSPDISIHH